MLDDLIDHGHGVRSVAASRSEVGLRCMAESAGFELRRNELYSWDGLKRGDVPFVLIQHTIAGRGHLDFAGSHHVLAPGQTMVLTFPHANRYWLERGESWEYFWLILFGREALRLAASIVSVQGPVLAPRPDAIEALAGACHALLSGTATRPGAVSSAAYQAIMTLYDHVFDREEGFADTATEPAPVRRAKAHLERNIATTLDVGTLARAAGLSRAHFVRQFTATMGEGPAAYVLRHRLERAQRLLLATDDPIKTIAGRCGFTSANYFAKVFRRHLGEAPEAYRRANRIARGEALAE